MVTHLGKQSMILGFTWLDKHNPEIDFRARSIKMTQCLPCCCVGCQADRKAERNARREDTERINTCRTGPFPAFIEDEAEPTPDPEADLPDEPLEEGDRIWATGDTPRLCLAPENAHAPKHFIIAAHTHNRPASSHAFERRRPPKTLSVASKTS